MQSCPSHLQQHGHLDKVSLLADGEGSVVRGVVGRQHHQLRQKSHLLLLLLQPHLAVVLVGEVGTVGELVAALLHGDAGAVSEASELLQAAHRHEGGHGGQRVGGADVPVELPRLGPRAHRRDRRHAAAGDGRVHRRQQPCLGVLGVPGQGRFRNKVSLAW